MTTPKVKGAAPAAPALARKDNATGDPTIGQASRQRIGNELRAMYSDLLNQPVPDRFVELIGRLEGRGEGPKR